MDFCVPLDDTVDFRLDKSERNNQNNDGAVQPQRSSHSILSDLWSIAWSDLRLRTVDCLHRRSSEWFYSLVGNSRWRNPSIFTYVIRHSTLRFTHPTNLCLERTPSIGQNPGFASLFFSIVFLLIGYIIGGVFVELHQQFDIKIEYLRKEYVYSALYGSIFYTVLVTLVRESDRLVISCQGEKGLRLFRCLNWMSSATVYRQQLNRRRSWDVTSELASSSVRTCVFWLVFPLHYSWLSFGAINID